MSLKKADDNYKFEGAPQGPTAAPAIKRKLDEILPDSVGS